MERNAMRQGKKLIINGIMIAMLIALTACSIGGGENNTPDTSQVDTSGNTPPTLAYTSFPVSR